MARVEFKSNSPVQSLSGTLGYLTYTTRYGRTFVHTAHQPTLPEHPTRAQKAKYKRDIMLNNCICILQDEMEDILLAIQLRPKMRERLKRLYNSYAPLIKAPTKLQKRIMTEYRARFLES